MNINVNLQKLIEEKRYAELKCLLEAMEPYDIAEMLQPLPDIEALILFRLLPKELAALTFVEFNSDRQEDWIRSFSDKELAAMLEELFVDDTVDIIEEMPANIVKRILSACDPLMRKDINEILKYPEGSAGTVMTTEYISLRPTMTVLEAFDRIRQRGVDVETINVCYVTDAQRILLGFVSIKKLLLSDMQCKIEEVMDNNFIYAKTTDDREEVAKQLFKYDLIILPVVDYENRLVGIITIDDAIDVIREETTEDIQLMGAVTPIEDSYLKTSVITHWSKRIVWLLIMMVSGIATGLIIDSYEAAFAALPLLVAFIPRLMDTGGNCGSQSSTMIIRGLAVDEIKPQDLGRIMFKELRIGLLVGVSLAILNIPVVWIMYGGDLSALQVWRLCLSFGLTLMIVVILAKMLGCILPVLAKKLRLDPALMSAPIITTLVDIFSVFIYFAIVSALVVPFVGAIG